MDDKLDDKSCFVHRHYAASGTFNLNDVRWAMGIVRARAVWITRSTTGTTFPALIPLLDLIPHRPGSGGSMKLGVDNVVTVTSGKTFTGGKTFEVFIDRETNATDADLLLAHHALAPGTNPHNAVRMRLPGTEISRVGVIRKIELLRSWRKEVSYFNFCMGNFIDEECFVFRWRCRPGAVTCGAALKASVCTATATRTSSVRWRTRRRRNAGVNAPSRRSPPRKAAAAP